MPVLDNPQIYQAILQSLPTGICLVDKNRKIIFWNDGAEKLTGYLRQDAVGRLSREHLLTTIDNTKNTSADLPDQFSMALLDGKQSTADVSILHKEGYRVPIVLRTIPIRNDRGAVIGVAESFDKNVSASEFTRRQSSLADFGCVDSVTGIPDHIFAQTSLEANLITFNEVNTPFGVVLVEIDQLDHCRCLRGPGVVPSILRVVAQSIENSLRPTDMIGCWPEHRFVLLLGECREEMVGLVAERIRKMVNGSEIAWWGDTFSVTCAFGGAGVRPGDDVASLMKRAESSLKEATAAGGDRVLVNQ